MESQVSAEYAQALAEANEATRKFRTITEQYRAREIGDDEFLKAQSLYKQAEAKFDAAFAKESA